MIPNGPKAWPLTCEAADPWAAEEWLDERGSWENHRLVGGTLEEPEHDRLDAAFLEAWRSVLRGDASAEVLAPLAEALLLPTSRTHDRRPLQVAPFPVDDELLADIVEDTLPDVGLVAPDRYLGPWADEAPPRRLVQAVAVNLCWIHLLDWDGSPCERWANRAPKPSIPLRRAVRAVAKAPPMLWTPDWRPLLPLADHFRPTGPVEGEVVPLGHETAAVLARLTPTEAGWRCNGAVSLPAAPPLGRLMARLELEHLRCRRHERRLTWEVFLRQRPEVLYRSCMTWLWWEIP